MKEKWEQIWKQLEKSDDELTAFLENAAISTLAMRKMQKFTAEWDKVKKLATEFDQYITPVEAIEVKVPFRSKYFEDMWQRWKDYLSEQHGQLMRTRSEKSALEHLVDISKSDEERAIAILRYAMANRYKNFFAIDEKDTKQPAKGESAGQGSDF